MDDLLQRCLSFPPHPPPAHPLSDEKYDEAIRIQVDALKKVNGDKLLLQTTGGENALDVINPALNTVPYAYLLTANHAGTHTVPLKLGHFDVQIQDLPPESICISEICDSANNV